MYFRGHKNSKDSTKFHAFSIDTTFNAYENYIDSEIFVIFISLIFCLTIRDFLVFY